jgi:exodeoxyribonuclease III
MISSALVSRSPLVSTRTPVASTAPQTEPSPPEVSDAVTLTQGVPEPQNGRTALQTALNAAAAATPGPAGALLKVLSYNTMLDCKEGVDKAVDLIRKTGADLVGLQESVWNTRALAKKLGMHWCQQDKRTALLSRFPIETVTPNRYAVAVKLPDGQKIAFANAHLTSFPFQSHQLCHLPTGGGPYLNTEEEAIASADKTRGDEVRTMISEADTLNAPVVATGDFNEPSFLDWTQEAADAGRHPIKVDWPASRQFATAGYTDSYREIYPDEMAKPGNTWTPTTSPADPADHHDRIDFVMYRGPELKLKSVEIVGESAEFADIVVTPFPSDHRGVLATFQVG